jgi:putative flippase GtrA
LNRVEKFIRFSIVGGICALIDYSVYFLGYSIFGLHYMTALAFSVILSGTTNYLLNKHFTFKDKSKNYLKQVSRFILVAVFGIILNFALMFVFVDLVEINPLIARLATIILVWFFNFGMHSMFTFKH